MNPIERIIPLGIPLAWLNLRKEPRRFLATVAGVCFAVTLMLFQMGLNTALFKQVVAPHLNMDADVVLASPQYEYFGIRRSFPLARLQQAASLEAVSSTAALYSTNLPLKNPETGSDRDIFVIAFDPAESPWKSDFIGPLQRSLKEGPNAIFDRLSQDGFGRFDQLLESQEQLPTELNGKAINITGTFEMGTTFAADGNLMLGLDTFLDVFPGSRRTQVDIGLVKLKPGYDAESTVRELRHRLMDDVQVQTISDFIADEQAYWSQRTPIGFVIGASMTVALIVGAVIVYQILYTDVNDHLSEYATLKSIGFSDNYFNSLVLQESLILSLTGFVPGLVLAAVLYHLTREFAHMPAYLSIGKCLAVLGLTTGMCLVAGAFATRKLKAANPADIF